MGLVMICRGRRARTPLSVGQTGPGLYSIEELAWYLYHNVCLIERRFFDERLCQWIGDELEEKELAHRIKSGIDAHANLSNLVIQVVGASDLYTGQEMTELKEKIRSLGTMQEQERLKLRADELLDGGSDWAAMDEYRHILKMHQNNRLGMAFYSAIWHNLGVCYAQQFLFEQAAECFETAYDYAPDEDTERQAELARSLVAGPPRGQEQRRVDYGNAQKKLLQWEQEYRRRQKQA